MRRDETERTDMPSPLTRGGPLDALRFAAAFVMVVHHYSNAAPMALERIHPALGRGYLATDFFLIVSGYVLGRVYGVRAAEGLGLGSFMLRRAARLVPAHLMVCAAFVLLVLAAGWAELPMHAKWFDWAELPAQVALVQAWGLVPGGLGWNAPTWSLSAVLACYVSFPGVWRALSRVQSPALILAMGIGGMAIADFATRQLLGQTVYQMPMQYGVLRAAPLFFLGLALAMVAQRVVIPVKVAVTLGFASLWLLVLVQLSGRYDFVSLSLIGLVILAAGAVPVRRPSRVLEKAALASFALFITSELVRVVYFGTYEAAAPHLGLGPQAKWAVWFGGTIGAVAVAVAFHHLIDLPSQAWIKAQLADGPRLRDRLAALFPHPDPDFDPLSLRVERGPRVREILLHAGPIPGASHGRQHWEGPSGLAWG